ncbi:MAG: hypothetical protein HXY21_06760 [Parvularculaceae bacterium]|nr:hypothetical protein [Parvularculaceae bacterium]
MAADLNIFAIAGAKARHAVERQSIIAENVANADTPGFRARDLESFEKALGRVKTRLGGAAARVIMIDSLGIAAPNGNTVSLEDQMMRASQASRDHDIATTIYAKSIAMLRAALGKSR